MNSAQLVALIAAAQWEPLDADEALRAAFLGANEGSQVATVGGWLLILGTDDDGALRIEANHTATGHTVSWVLATS